MRPSTDLDPETTAVESSSGDAQQPVVDASQTAPLTIGRYLILEELGVGGMGRVYLAYDPKLRRELALKVLRRHGSADDAARGRMLREAQAQAQLNHPNVVPVYDVDTDGSALHIAMEYVRGQTMQEWLRSPRSRAELLTVLREAGKGLGAAHEAGLVHRDFKPANVLIGEDGRVRVMDFGLARGNAEEPEPERSCDTSQVSLSASYTIAGSVVGTPLYMAPEQHLGTDVDPRADQYAFCVSVVMALCGRSPFPGTSFEEVAKLKHEGRMTLPSPELPNWIALIVRRGLAPKAEDRWPSMQALLDQLTRDPAQRRRRFVRVGAGLLVLAGVTLALTWGADTEQAPVCAGSERKLEGVWDKARRARSHAAFAETELAYAEQTWTQVEIALDARVEVWTSARTQACEATRVHGEQSETMLDQRMHCFDRRLDELDAFVELLTEADVALVNAAGTAVERLADVSSCEGSELIGRRALPSEPEARARLATLSREIGQATALVAAGRFEDAKPGATQAERDAVTLGYPWIETEAAMLLGRVGVSLGDLDGARAALSRAVVTADAAGEDSLRLQALTTLMRNAMHKDGDLEAALRHRIAAEAVLERIGAPPYERIDYLDAWAIVLAEQGRFDEAIEQLEAALLLAQAHAPARVAGIQTDLGAALVGSGSHERALAINEQRVHELETKLGPDHPELGDALTNVSASLQALGQHERALAVSNRLVAIQETSRGPRSPDTADAYNNRAVVYGLLERHDEAAADYERTRAIWAAVAPAHPRYGVATFNLSETHLYRGDPEQALRLLDEAARVFEASLPPEHPYGAFVLAYRGWALLELGRVDEAAQVLTPALERLVESKIDLRTEAQARLLLGEVHLRQGSVEAGLAMVREAKSQLEQTGANYWSRRAQRSLDDHAG